MEVGSITRIVGFGYFAEESVFGAWTNNIGGRTLTATLDYCPHARLLCASVMEINESSSRAKYYESRHAYFISNDRIVFVDEDGMEFVEGTFAHVVRGNQTEMRIGGKSIGRKMLS